MTRSVDVSVIIPTFNRRSLVESAIRSVLAQTHRVDEIIVVDDGSTDGTGQALQALFGDQIHYIWQANGGVSSARNHGLRVARGRYLTLLDSDDLWLPDKTRLQVQWLDSHPDFGMVLCDVVRMDANCRDFEVFHRRKLLPEDGHILKWVLLEPALVPASVMLRREVFDAVGGFDESLHTAEDLDYHLRIATHCKIGVIEQTLVRAMRGHDGLSSEPGTYDDYLLAIERAVAHSVDLLPPIDRDRALAQACARAARGKVLMNRPSDAWALARRAWALSPDAASRWKLLRLAPLAVRRAVARLVRRRPH